MNFAEWIANAFKRPQINRETGEIMLCEASRHLEERINYKTLALNACIDFVANALISCEFQIFDHGKLSRDEIYYKLNIEPNELENASKFWRKAIARLFSDNACGIWLHNKQLYVLDSFDLDDDTGILRHVKLNGKDISNIYGPEVLYFEWKNAKIKQYVDGIYSDIGKLVGAVTDSTIKHQYTKLLVDIPMTYPQTKDAQEKLNKLINYNLKNLISNQSNAISSLTNGLNVSTIDLGGAGGSASKNDLSVRGIVDDYIDYVALAVGIPTVLLRGDVADTKQAIVNFVAFCLDPLTKTISQEFNRKYFRQQGFLNKTFLKIDTSRIQLSGISAQAEAINVLVRSGVLSVDDSLIMMGREPLGEDWSKTHWITRNYATVENAMLDESIMSPRKGGNNGQEENQM